MTARFRCVLLLLSALGLRAFGGDDRSALVSVPSPTTSEIEELAAMETLPYSKKYDAYILLSENKRRRFSELFRNFNSELTYNEIRAHRVDEVNINWRTLVALGDYATGKYLSREVLRDPPDTFSEPWDRLMEWRSSQVIKELGVALEKNEPIWGRSLEINDTNIDPRARAFSSKFAEHILYVASEPAIYMGGTKSAAPYFPELSLAAKASLKAFYEEWKHARNEMTRNGRTDPSYSETLAFTDSYTASRSTVKAWWLANKEAFLSEKYAEVKPLDEATTIHPAMTANGQFNNASALAPAPAAAVIPLPPESAQEPSMKYVFLAVISAILAILGVFIRKHLTRNNQRAP